MKTVVTTEFVCECCGLRFSDEEKCRAHEDLHSRPKSVMLPEKSVVRAYRQTRRWPDVVDVVMSDGSIARYGIQDENERIDE